MRCSSIGLSPEADAVDVFYRGWTRKEAYLKAWGTGLTFSSRGFSLSFGEQDCRVVETGMPGDDGRGWSFSDLDVGARRTLPASAGGAATRL